MTTLLCKEPRNHSAESENIPRSFLARCRAIVESVTTARSGSIPLPVKHKVEGFRPNARAVGKPRVSTLLKAPAWNERTARQTEVILGIILIVIAILLLKPEDNDETVDSTPAVTATQFEQGDPKHDEAPVEMPYLVSTFADPVMVQQMASSGSLPAYAHFHAFARPVGRFSFETAPSWKTNYLMSTRVVRSVARHVQPVAKIKNPVKRIHKGRVSPQVNKSVHSRVSGHSSRQAYMARIALKMKALKHPLLGRLMSRTNNGAANRLVSSKAPVVGVMSRFRDFSRVMIVDCGPGPDGDGGSGE
jgi:hypothetical protein